MYGPVGVVEPEAEELRACPEQACDVICHPSPDEAGLRCSRGTMPGFRALEILDLSTAGHQLVLSPGGRLAPMFDREIYNYRELRCELGEGCPFRSRTDSMALPTGFAAWGWEKPLRRIDGMIAFAIWDDRIQTLYATRDEGSFGRSSSYLCSCTCSKANVRATVAWRRCDG